MILAIEMLFLIALIACDLITKQLICGFLLSRPSQEFSVVDNVFTFVYSENYGAGFGAFNGNQIFLIIVTGLVSLAIFGFLIYKRKSSPRMLRVGLLVCLAGAVGNLVDRIAFGFVRDFLDYTFLNSWFGINFPICNIADLFVFVGAIVIVLYMFEFREIDFLSEKSLRKKMGKNANSI